MYYLYSILETLRLRLINEIAMRLTLDEFKKIRKLQWNLRSFGNKTYNTTINQTETQLFWLDFMRNVFAPKFKKQFGLTYISDFDQTQPVLLTDDLELKLPTQLETAMYFANNVTPPVTFAFNISQSIVTGLAIVTLIIILILHVLYSKKINFKRII